MAPQVFTFDIGKDISLTVTPQDTEIVSDVGKTTGLMMDEYSPLLIKAFAEVLGNPLTSCITKSQYDAAMRKLLPEVSSWSDMRKEHLSYFLSNLFYSFDSEERETVPTDELLVALSILCGGSKTSKLAFAFALFDSSGDEQIEQAELARLLSAILVGLFAVCTDGCADVTEEEVEMSVHHCSVRMALDIFTDLGKDDEESLSFHEFGWWYNEFGFEKIQWLELLDLSKWPKNSTIEDDDDDEEEEEGKEETEDEEYAPLPKPVSKDAPIISFEFPAPMSAKVSITENDVARLAQILNLTDMHKLDAGALAAVFFTLSDEGSLMREGFDDSLREVVDFQQLIEDATLDEKEALQVVDEIHARFACFFKAFERSEGQGANVDEISAGFSLLCAGNKSEKLAHAWELVSFGRKEGRLTRRGLWRFLRSFLQMLMAMSAMTRDLSSGELCATSDSGAVWTAALVFDQTKETRSEENSITFDEFAEWYTVGGFKSASWFELLDLKKWVMAPANGDDNYDDDEDSDYVPSSSDDEGDSEDDSEESEDDDDDVSVIFSFQLTEAGHCLYITSADSGSVMRVVAISSLFELTCDELATALNPYAQVDMNSGEMVMSMKGYNEALRQVLPSASDLGDQASIHFLTTALANVYYAYVPPGEQVAPFADLLTGLSLFVQGSKSMKLQHGFSAFDGDADDLLTGVELHRFLSAVLSVLFACAKQTASLPPDQSRALVNVASDVLVQRIMNNFTEQADLVSFEEFGNWYNEEGCEVAPWLELLDLSKWKLKPQSETSTTKGQLGWGEEAEDDEDSAEDEEGDDDSIDSDDYGYVEAQAKMKLAEEDDEDDDNDNLYDTGDHNARFRFPLMNSTGDTPLMTLRLSETDVATLRNLVNRTGLCTMSPESVCGPMMDAADDGLLGKRDFDAVVRNLIPASGLSKEERSLFSVLLSSIFYNFEATADVPTSTDASELVDSANALELTIGISLLCHGDKSSKLNYAWQIIDLDEDGYLNRAELLFFLRSFLRMLLALSFEAASMGSAVVRRHATEMAGWLSSTVISRYGDKAGLVSFDDFAQWYQDGFHQVAPWLELLDLSKWVL